ncbi:MAG TPA: DUF6599 family protein [archaeon]|nr:DUF6599 family protein [archaeon]
MISNIAPEVLATLETPPPGFSPTGFRSSYKSENLHDYLNGGAERYLGYGFKELVVCEFIFEQSRSPIVAEIYLMNSPANAYGIFSSDRAGENPDSVGLDAALGDYLLQFWQGPYFVRIMDSDLAGGLKNALLSFGKSISAAMPGPQASDRPEIISLLPVQGCIPSSVCYFHTQNSLNSLVYLGEKNLLGLGPEVEAVSAEYRIKETGRIIRCLIIRYPTGRACKAGFENLVRSRDKLPEAARRELSHLSVFAEKLLVVFGKAESTWIRNLEEKLNQ